MLHHLCWFNLAERWENNYDLQKYLHFQCLLAFGLWIPSFLFWRWCYSKMPLGFFHSKAAHVQKKKQPQTGMKLLEFLKKNSSVWSKLLSKKGSNTSFAKQTGKYKLLSWNRMYSNYTRNDVLHLTRCSSPLNGEKLL